MKRTSVLTPEVIEQVRLAVRTAQADNKINPRTGQPYKGVMFRKLASGFKNRGIESRDAVNQLIAAGYASFVRGPKATVVVVYADKADVPVAKTNAISW